MLNTELPHHITQKSKPYKQLRSWSISLFAHGLLALALFFSVRWQIEPKEEEIASTQAELWAALPPVSQSKPQKTYIPPKTVASEALADIEPTNKPDIALKTATQKKKPQPLANEEETPTPKKKIEPKQPEPKKEQAPKIEKKKIEAVEKQEPKTVKQTSKPPAKNHKPTEQVNAEDLYNQGTKKIGCGRRR